MAAAPAFFLHSLHVEGFRSLEDATFHFQPGLNVIIGANNAAKTAVIDALRIVFGLGTFEKKEDLIRLRATDVFIDAGAAPKSPQSICFTATFYGKADSDLGSQFYDLACNETTKAGLTGEEYSVFKLRYRADFEFLATKERYEYVRSDLRGGANLDHPVAYDVLDTMRAIYLAPLRDLVNDHGRVGAEIERLILSHTPADKQDERRQIPGALKQQASDLIERVTGNTHHAAASKNLAEYAKPYGFGDDSLSFIPAGISDGLFRNMWPVFSHSLHGAGRLPLSSNGLGINQLIYASIVLSRRGEAGSDDGVRKFFLIEEPEAHLHPQLQDSFFHALNQITDHQVFVTSHSPTITAKTDIEKIIVMRRDKTDRVAVPLHLGEAYEGRDLDRRYLHKFLDVTRSQVLFAKGAVFVEGVTEAMLLQRFSEIMGCSLRDHAIEVVVVNSNEGFNHFRPLFEHGGGVYSRAVFITDGDEDPSEVKSDASGGPDLGLSVTGSTAVAIGYGTFEFGLLRTAIAGAGHPEMQELLTQAFKAAAPSEVVNSKQQDAFVRDFLDFENPGLAYKKMKERKKGTYVPEDAWYAAWHTNSHFKTAKSEFAFCLNEALADLSIADAKTQFTVPNYIQDAIKWVLGDPDTKDADRALDA